MAFQFHKDADLYYRNQFLNSLNYILPFIKEHIPTKGKLLEIGCAHGGVIKPFTDAGWIATGVDLNPLSIQKANKIAEEDVRAGRTRFIAKNIYEASNDELGGPFDLIILKDTIEHIPGQQKLVEFLKRFLAPGGVIYFGFPPWYMPFGGHQQVCKNKLLANLPYYHLLPMSLYSWLLKIAGEKDPVIEELKEIKTLGISIERFERIVKNTGYQILKKKHYLINPIYEFKFGLKPRRVPSILNKIPFIRNFYTTGVFYLIRPN